MQAMSATATWRLAPSDRGYPISLRALGDRAPTELHGAGDPAVVTGLDHDATVTVVGSRRSSSYGRRVAERLGRDLASAGITVVSGMAWGIDSAAHRGALAAGGPTIAVLAGGPDIAYPRSAARLHREILAAGAAIAERPPGTRPERWSFPVRNRIMAALASLVVVVEAADPSGSLITAREAGEMGREVGAVPGQVGMATAAGTNGLLADGAAVIRCAEDVLDRLAGVGARVMRRPGRALDPQLARALALVEAGAATPDALALAGGLAPHDAAVALARLELLGYVSADAAGAYERTALPSGGARVGGS
jgi:DNA processing protein